MKSSLQNIILRVEPTQEFFSITWMLGSFCNYDCMYCPSELHDAISKNHDLATLKELWKKIYIKTQHLNMPYKISFTGGEVTANKSFLPFMQWLRDSRNQFNIAMLLITTNGSASGNYYLNLADVVESISFSTHSEFMDECSFFEKCIAINSKMVKPEKSFHVNLMNEFWNQDRILLYKKLLDNHGISYSVNEINFKYQTRDSASLKGKQNIERLFN